MDLLDSKKSHMHRFKSLSGRDDDAYAESRVDVPIQEAQIHLEHLKLHKQSHAFVRKPDHTTVTIDRCQFRVRASG